MEVIIYGTETCPYCTMVKQFLDEKKVKYEYIDVSKDQAKSAEMQEKSGQMGVPVVDIDGAVIVGFDKEKIVSALEE